jgi:hypothetical protein
VKVVAETLGVARSNLHDRLKGTTKPRRRYHKAQDAALVPLINALVTARPTYGYRRITAVLNRQLRADGLAPVNHKRVYRIMQAHSLLLARHYTERPDLAHDGKVIVMRSNLRSPSGSDRWRLRWLAARTASSSPAGMVRWSGVRSSSTPMTERSSPGAL